MIIDKRILVAIAIVTAVVMLGSIIERLPDIDEMQGPKHEPVNASAPEPDERLTADTNSLGAGQKQREHASEMREKEVARRFQQGITMLHAKRYEEAIMVFHRVLALQPEMPEAHTNLGYALIGAEQYSMAEDFFNAALGLKAGQLNAYYGLALVLEKQQQLPEAIGAMRTYLHLSSKEDPYFHKAKSILALWEGQQAQALSLGESAGVSEHAAGE